MEGKGSVGHSNLQTDLVLEVEIMGKSITILYLPVVFGQHFSIIAVYIYTIIHNDANVHILRCIVINIKNWVLLSILCIMVKISFLVNQILQ